MTRPNGNSSVSAMSTVTLPFIPAYELQALVKGSHQALAEAVACAVSDASDFQKQSVRVIATFDSHAIVLAESGAVYRVSYERALDGSVHLLRTEVEPVTVVDAKSISRYIRREASEAVSLFMRGLTLQANAKISALVPLAEYADAPSDALRVQTFKESRVSTRVWRTMLEGRRTAIESYLGEAISSLKPLQERFSKLYDGSTPADELPVFKSLVATDMGTILDRLSAVETQTRRSLELIDAVKAEALATGQGEAVQQIETLAVDLLADVASVKEFAQDALEGFEQVDSLAKVFDSVATEVASFEVASAFAHKVATRLTDNGR